MHRVIPAMEANYERLVGRHVNGLEQRVREATGLHNLDRQWTNAALLDQADHELDRMFRAVDYRAVADQMGTGDVLLTHGTAVTSLFIKVTTHSWYSHVSMVVRDPDASTLKLYGITQPDPDGLYVLESEPHTVDGREGGGVQLLSLHEWAAKTKRYFADKQKSRCFVAWRQLHFVGSHHPRPRTAAEVPGLSRMLHAAHGRGYEVRKRELVASAMRANSGEDLSTVFCSELIAWAYKAMGLLPDAENASNWTPIQFSAMYRDDKINCVLAAKANLHPDRRLKVDSAPAKMCS